MVKMIKLGREKKPRLGTMEKKRSEKINNLIAICFLILSNIIVFLLIKDKLLFTPDFGESDAYHFNLSLKYFLADSLKKGVFPFWTDSFQAGFPIFSEGQIGSLFIPNIFFLSWLPFYHGYNCLLVFSLLCLSIGYYLLLKRLQVRPILAFLFSLIFSFNGAISLRWVHLNLIQSFSLSPLLFVLLIDYFSKKRPVYLIAFIFVASQMILAGHSQTAFIVFFGISVWLTFSFIAKKNPFPSLIRSVFAIIMAFWVSLGQILPTLILISQSERQATLDYNTVTSFPFNWNQLISFFAPYQFGNPKLGGYAPFSSNWGIFWENTPFLGSLATVITVIAIISFFRSNRRAKKDALISLVCFGLFTLLALGKNSPLYFVFGFFPFNLFRTPSKYLLMAVFFIVIFFAISLEDFFRKLKNSWIRTAVIFCLILNLASLVFFVFDYHLYINKDLVLSAPEIVEAMDDRLYISVGQPATWNKIFIKNGWSKKNDIDRYLFYKNYLYPNSNLITNKKSFSVNTGAFKLRRLSYLEALIVSGIRSTDNQIKVTKEVIPLFNLTNLGQIISGSKIESPRFKLVKKLTGRGDEIFLYRYDGVSDNHYYIPKHIDNISYLNEFSDKVTKGEVSTLNSVVEKAGLESYVNSGRYRIDKSSCGETACLIKGWFAEKTFLAFKKNYYPEWSVYIDGKKQPFFKTNLINMGVFVPPGTHTISLQYENRYFKMGLLLSAVGWVFLAILIKLKIF